MLKCQGIAYEERSPRACPRDAKAGEQYCGPHLAGRRRSEAAFRAAQAQYEREQAWRQQVHAARQAFYDTVARCPHCDRAYRAFKAAAAADPRTAC
jgi:hypothetical protein